LSLKEVFFDLQDKCYFCINGKIVNSDLKVNDIEDESTLKIVVQGKGGMDFITDDEYKENKDKPSAFLQTRKNIFGEREIIPKYRSPRLFVAYAGLKTIFGTDTVEEINREKAIEIKKTQFYASGGISIAYKNEADLFEDYKNLFDKEFKDAPYFLYGAWRGAVAHGAVIDHPGKVKVNGLRGAYKNQVITFVKKTLNEMFEEKKFIYEPIIDVIREKVKNGTGWSNKWWCTIYFVNKENALYFIKNINYYDGCANLNVSGISSDCLICGRKKCEGDCDLYGLRVTFPHVTNIHMKSEIIKKLEINDMNLVIGNGGNLDKNWAYIWYDNENKRNDSKKAILDLIADGVIINKPKVVKYILKECRICGYVPVSDDDTHFGNNCTYYQEKLREKEKQKEQQQKKKEEYEKRRKGRENYDEPKSDEKNNINKNNGNNNNDNGKIGEKKEVENKKKSEEEKIDQRNKEKTKEKKKSKEENKIKQTDEELKKYDAMDDEQLAKYYMKRVGKGLYIDMWANSDVIDKNNTSAATTSTTSVQMEKNNDIKSFSSSTSTTSTSTQMEVEDIPPIRKSLWNAVDGATNTFGGPLPPFDVSGNEKKVDNSLLSSSLAQTSTSSTSTSSTDKLTQSNYVNQIRKTTDTSERAENTEETKMELDSDEKKNTVDLTRDDVFLKKAPTLSQLNPHFVPDSQPENSSFPITPTTQLSKKTPTTTRTRAGVSPRRPATLISSLNASSKRERYDDIQIVDRGIKAQKPNNEKPK